jgi:transcription antitermination protein NusB
MSTRRRAREVVLQMLYQLEASALEPRQVLEAYRSSFGDGPLPDEFARDMFLDIAGRVGELDGVIVSASDNWRLERMSRVDRNILRVGVFELCHRPDTPPRVAINEAVELAKRFGTEDSAAFVNGVLDRIARDTRRLT